MSPTAALPATASLLQEGAWGEVAVQDVSVGGVALVTTPALRERARGERMTIRLSLGIHGEHTVAVDVRHVTETKAGVQFVDLTPEATTSVRRYVADLLERGALL